jgi:hypothetical protein
VGGWVGIVADYPSVAGCLPPPPTFPPGVLPPVTPLSRHSPCAAPRVPARISRHQIEAKKKERLAQREEQEVADCTFAPDLGLTRDVLESHNMGTGRCVRVCARVQWAARVRRGVFKLTRGVPPPSPPTGNFAGLVTATISFAWLRSPSSSPRFRPIPYPTACARSTETWRDPIFCVCSVLALCLVRPSPRTRFLCVCQCTRPVVPASAGDEGEEAGHQARPR